MLTSIFLTLEGSLTFKSSLVEFFLIVDTFKLRNEIEGNTWRRSFITLPDYWRRYGILYGTLWYRFWNNKSFLVDENKQIDIQTCSAAIIVFFGLPTELESEVETLPGIATAPVGTFFAVTDDGDE